MKTRLNIALVSLANPFDRKTWSGSTFFMKEAIQRHMGNVDHIGPHHFPGETWKKPLSRWKKVWMGIQDYPHRTESASRHYGNMLTRMLKKKDYDLVFAPAAGVEIAHLTTSIPILYVSDTTFELVKMDYPIFKNLSQKAKCQEALLERKALFKASLISYPSEWAARSAISHYRVAKKKIAVIPFGANLEQPPMATDVQPKNVNGVLRMLFLGKDWNRKGGTIAYETLIALRQSGIDAHLTVCGSLPPSHCNSPYLKVIPYIDKNIPEQAEKLNRLFQESHLMILPTRAECYGIVFCEGNAFGLPVYSTRVGGISSIVQDGVNGYLFPPWANGEVYARHIKKMLNTKNAYETLSQQARCRFENHLNWDSWAREIRRAVFGVLGI